MSEREGGQPFSFVLLGIDNSLLLLLLLLLLRLMVRAMAAAAAM
jgi:hypothetical protein